jgi:hypothetical protein
MKRRTPGLAGRRKGLGRRTAGVLVGLALALVPVSGQNLSFSLAQGQPPPADHGLPSEDTAMALTVIGTVAAVASFCTGNGWVFMAGLTFGPSLGFFYGGCWGRGLLSSVLRLGATIALFAWAFNEEASAAPGTLWLAAMGTSVIFDMLTVKKAVRKRNASVMARRGVKVGVSPFALPRGGGIQVQVSF